MSEEKVHAPKVRTAFDVVLARRGVTLHVPANRSITSVLIASGVNHPTSCGVGICGTCRTRVLEGEPDHWDAVLTAREKAAGDQIIPCCSRAMSDVLVLDI